MVDTQVFSHNDVQENNCLIDKNDRLWLIDYEYSQINFRANDVANFIAENQFAYDEPPAAFVYHPENKWDLNGQKFRDVSNAYHGKDLSEEEFTKFKDEVQRCLVFQNFWWAVWSLVMIPPNDISGALDFVMPFAKVRFDMYFDSFKEYKINGGAASILTPKTTE